jgi:hypothetical protein
LTQSGGYIPSVDHQTPPGVSLDQYRIYLHLLEEYANTWAAAASGPHPSTDTPQWTSTKGNLHHGLS